MARPTKYTPELLDKANTYLSTYTRLIPSHQDLCDYEQEYFYNSISEDIDLKSHMEDAFKSLHIALSFDEAVKKSITVYLD